VPGQIGQFYNEYIPIRYFQIAAVFNILLIARKDLFKKYLCINSLKVVHNKLILHYYSFIWIIQDGGCEAGNGYITSYVNLTHILLHIWCKTNNICLKSVNNSRTPRDLRIISTAQLTTFGQYCLFPNRNPNSIIMTLQNFGRRRPHKNKVAQLQPKFYWHLTDVPTSTSIPAAFLCQNLYVVLEKVT